jgi:hypothetical protein
VVNNNIEEAFATISEPLDLNDREEYYAKRVLKTFIIQHTSVPCCWVDIGKGDFRVSMK